jgi:hypothetical protein
MPTDGAPKALLEPSSGPSRRTHLGTTALPLSTAPLPSPTFVAAPTTHNYVCGFGSYRQLSGKQVKKRVSILERLRGCPSRQQGNKLTEAPTSNLCRAKKSKELTYPFGGLPALTLDCHGGSAEQFCHGQMRLTERQETLTGRYLN